MSYRAGDHLGVIGRNQLSLVRRVAARFDLEPEARIVLRTTGGLIDRFSMAFIVPPGKSSDPSAVPSYPTR